MKKIILHLIALLITATIFSQPHVRIGFDIPNNLPFQSNVSNDQAIEVPKNMTNLNIIKVFSSDLPSGHKLTITIAGEPHDYITPNREVSLTFMNDILDKDISIEHFDDTPTHILADDIKFRITPTDDQDQDEDNESTTQPSVDQFLEVNYSDLEATPFGYINPKEKNRVIHIFFDQFGNSLLSTVPQGISNAQYIVHIIYPISFANPNKISYSVKQKTGSFSSNILFNNTGIRNQLGGILQSGEKFDAITERTFLLGTATDDLSFDIVAKEGKSSKVVLESYTIKMSSVYHGSFDIGLLRTNLSNPAFNLVQSPTSSDNVVKITDESPKGVVSVMASFYVSPIILLESLGKRLIGGNKIPFYKLTGRNFLDDHKIYERFYPTVGVSLSNKVFENIFYGVNWEIARGLSIFGGWHYGKVNTFEMPNFEQGITPVTQKEFDFYKNTRWKTSTALGVKLDILIIRNLFGASDALK